MRDPRRSRSAALARPAVAALLCAGGVAAVSALGAAPASAVTEGSSTTSSFVPTATKALDLNGATLLGPTDPSTPITVRAVLNLRDMSGLNAFIANPGSTPLTPSEFDATYGPTSAQVQSVESYLESAGFSDVSATPNGILVSASGTVGEAEQAFDTSISSYELAGQEVFANTTAASVPSDIASSVGAVLGLNDVDAMHSTLRTQADSTPNPAVPASGTSLPQYDVSYTPNQFPGIYGATAATPTGAKTSIAIIAEGDLTQVVQDLRTEEKLNDLPQVPVKIVPTGIASPDTSGADEWDMDTQVSTAMAGTVKKLYLYDATSLTDSDLALAFNDFASQDVAQAGSASLGECETFPYLDGSMLADDEAFAEAAAQGQSFFASSGDTGGSCAVEDTNGVPDSGPPQVNYPASSPYVTAVGGTTLLTNSDGSYDEEIAWNSGGGGTSLWESAPYWQSGVVPGATAGKGVPDIAMDADPYSGVTLVIDGTESEGYGGTSLSSPLALGVWARLESGHANKLGMASPALYATYSAGSCTALEVTNYCTTAAFHDITLGTNGAYAATPGWDYTTGLGSFDIQEAEQLVK